MSEPKTEIILSIAVFSHGCEELLTPFAHSDPVGEFYRSRVKVFSQACVPGLPSVTMAHEHKPVARDIIRKMQSPTKATSDTNSILEPYITACKSKYSETFTKKRVDMDPRLFDKKHIDRSCGTTVFLANKTFQFYDEIPGDHGANLVGIALLDVRAKHTDEHGNVTYERIFEQSPRRTEPFVLTEIDGLTHLLKTVLKIKATKSSAIIKKMGLSKRTPELSRIDLIQLHELFAACGVDYVNIVDYSCRTCSIRLSEEQIESIHEREQRSKTRVPRFGGKRIRLTRFLKRSESSSAGREVVGVLRKRKTQKKRTKHT
jgi:hypothetical protein